MSPIFGATSFDDAGDPAPCDHVYTWRAWVDATDRTLAQHTLPSGTMIRTVFLSLNHAFRPGPPVLWETVVMGGPFDGTTWRYTSATEALDGHQVVVNTVLETEEAQIAVQVGLDERVLMAA